MSSTFVLLSALRKELCKALESLPLAVHDRRGGRTGETRPAQVHLGSMPPTAQEAISAAPFVVVQAMSGQDEAGLHEIAVVLRLCVVSADMEEAEEDLHNLISACRLCLQSLPGGVVGGRFRMSPESAGVPWERPDDQALPFLQAHIFTNWQTQGASQCLNTDTAFM